MLKNENTPYSRKIIGPNIPFGRLLKYDELAGIVEEFIIYYSDVVAGANYSMISSVAENIAFGELELSFNNATKFKRIAELVETTPLAIEVFIHEDYTNLEGLQFNKFYFIDYEYYENNMAELKREFKIKAIDFSGAIENETICEHNVEYDAFQTDADGNRIEPPNFNMIVFNTTQPYAIYEDMFQFNVNTPVDRNKGTRHNTEITRKPKGIGRLYNLFEFSNDGLSYTSEKKTLFEIRREINQILKNQNDVQQLPNLELKLVGGELQIWLVAKDNIEIDNYINKDRIITQTREKDYRNSVEDALVESDKLDMVSAHKVRTRANVWKQKETIESASPDAGTEESPHGDGSAAYVAPLNTKCDEILGDGTPIDKAELEMNIKGESYFDSIDTHTIIDVKNFGDMFDGQYRIDKISCVVEQTYLSYSLETITKINN